MYADASCARCRGTGACGGPPVPVLRAHYPAASVSARGVFRRTHAPGRRAVVLQRRDQATYALVFFRKATAPGALYAPAEAGMVQTFRARKPG